VLERLLDRPSWPHREFDALARELGLMPGAVLDQINNWSPRPARRPNHRGRRSLVVNRELVT
jgi:hypothetical protein